MTGMNPFEEIVTLESVAVPVLASSSPLSAIVTFCNVSVPLL